MAGSKKNPQQTVLLVQNRKQVLVVWWVLHAGEKYEKTLVSHYYTTFDSNLAGLANMYQEGSMLTFEGEKIMGAHNIVASRKPICI
ncbi:nuclear transport factor 2A [Striga hermonthica]|uniref:Nuclear transport factor 2A n=1 Tax=Striga hermonthica TaxID=68872 RepID=A0A9N7NBX7_STRHE|nr:nuclear transport factor 2A [Striga hermonthica]